MLSLYLLPEQRFHTKAIVPGVRLRIDGDEAHHIAKVARHHEGDRILISDGRGVRATVVIEAIDRKAVEVVVEEITRSEDPKVRLRVIQALTKSDRANECVELLVGAGVDEIIPWQAERSIGKWDATSSPEKWRSWIRSAVKQTRRDRIPRLADLFQLSSLTKREDEAVVVFDEGASSPFDAAFAQEMESRFAPARTITVVIGPEGGLSEREVAALREQGALIARLGVPILRSAHAGAAALIAVQAALSIWR